jgi:hypothetical protein
MVTEWQTDYLVDLAALKDAGSENKQTAKLVAVVLFLAAIKDANASSLLALANLVTQTT